MYMQVIQDWVAQHLEVSKKMDDAILAGKYDVYTSMPTLPSFRVDECIMDGDKKKEHKTNRDIEDDQCVLIGEEHDTKKLLDNLYKYCITQKKWRW